MLAASLATPGLADIATPSSTECGWTNPNENGREAKAVSGQGSVRLPDGVEEAPLMDKAAALGAAVWLMAQSPPHMHTFLADLTWMVMPPIDLNQFKLFRSGSQPFAFAAWAKISIEAEGRLNGASPRLAPADWAGGGRVWLVNLVAPFGAQDRIIEFLGRRDLRDTVIRGHTVAPNGQRAASIIWPRQS